MGKANPAIVLANYYQFTPGESTDHPLVRSRMLLWCKKGSGDVIINGASYHLSQDAFVLQPWNHSISYKASDESPFLVGGIHFIPDYPVDAPIYYNVPHSPESHHMREARGRDEYIEGCGGVLYGSFRSCPSLAHLAEYMVSWFSSETKLDDESRMLGRLFVRELASAVEALNRSTSTPKELQALLNFIRLHLHDKLSADDLAQFMGCSQPTMARMFRRYLGTSPVGWITRERMALAAGMLASTHIPVKEVGEQVGIDDIYYFSKLFKRAYGLAPTAYRSKAPMLVKTPKSHR